MFSQEQLESLSTPCYIFDERELEDNFNSFGRALREAWGDNEHVCYSVKTNPFPWILKKAKECDCLAEVVSDDEYDLALTCGFDPCEIVFNGPVKGRRCFEHALSNGAIVNIDSKRELRWLEEIARESCVPVKVGVRVNIDLEKFCPGQTIGGDEPGRFGFSYEDGEVAAVLSRIKGMPGVVIAGLHMHVTTYGRTPYAYRVLASHAASVIAENDLAGSLEYVDMGGGYYGGGPQNEGRYEEYAAEMASELKTVCDPAAVELLVEPGGAVICTPGYYAGRVVDVKDVRGHRFVVSELSRLNIDHEMKKTSYPLVLFTERENAMPKQSLCGFTCMESDRLCILEDERELSEGDIILIRFAGAYSMSFTPGFFIEHAPAVYSYRDGAFELHRSLFEVDLSAR